MSKPTGFNELVVSVFDIGRIRAVFESIGGWTARPLPDAPVEQYAAWHVPAECQKITQLLLSANADGRGALRLVKFEGVTEQVLMRPAQHTWDTGGLFDFDVYVEDMQKVYRALQRCGWTAFGVPTDYAWGGFDVCEGVMVGPDGIVVGLLKAYGKVMIDLPPIAGMSRAFNASQVVRDYDVAMDFHLNQLGWKALVDTEVIGVEEPGRNILGIPRPLATSTRRRVGIVHPGGLNDGSIEIIEMKELDGHDYAANCVAPNVGLFSCRFPVADIAAYRRQVVAQGVDLYSDLAALEIAPYGTVRCFSVRSPDGAILEFFGKDSG